MAGAAVSFTGSLVEVNFDSMAGENGMVGFQNDSTIPGLMLYLSGGNGTGASAGVPDMLWRGTGTVSAIASNNSTIYPAGAAIAFYFYRPTGSTDVALGLNNADSNSRGLGTGYIAAGLALVNNTGQSIPSVSFGYNVSATSNAFTNADPVGVSYAYGAAGVADADGIWNSVANLGYNVAADGTVTAPSTTEIDGLNWLPGQTLVIRFRDANVGGTDRLSFIDDITFIPEPSSLGLVGSAIGLLALRRRVQR